MRRLRNGFTLLEVLLVLAAVAILVGIVVIPGVAARERAVVRVMQHDLESFAELQELQYRLQRTYVPVSDLLSGGGFALSRDVRIDSAAVTARDRVYLRVSHPGTTKRCSIDYSRASSAARNRIQCFDAGQTEVLAAERPATAGIDTFHLTASAPEPPEPPPAPGAPTLLSPLVSRPADQSGLPGASMLQTFQVTNRSSVARSFALSVSSSNGGVVPGPANPATLTIAPGTTSPILLPYTAGPFAEAGAFSVLPLVASDTQDPTLSGRGDFTFHTLLAPAAPTLSALADQVVDPGQDVLFTWNAGNSTNAPRMMVGDLTPGVPPGLVLQSVTNDGEQPFAAFQSRPIAALFHLDYEGAEGGRSYPLTLDFYDQESPALRVSDQVVVTARLILDNPFVLVPGVFAYRNATPGQIIRIMWLIGNRSNAARELSIVPSVGGDLSIVSQVGTGVWRIGKRMTRPVTIDYRLNPLAVAPGSSPISLTVTDVAAPGYTSTETHSISTRVVRKNPTLSSVSSRSEVPDATFSASWTVKNETNTAAVLSLTPTVSNGELAITGGTNTGDVSFAAFETKTVTATYRVRSGSVAGTTTTATLSAFDRADPTVASSSAFTHSTALVERAPTVSAPGSKTYNPQGSYGETFRVTNPSNAPQTLRLVASSSNGGVVADPGDPGDVAFSAYEGRDISVGFTVHWVQAGATSSIGLSAQNLSSGASASSSLTATVAMDTRVPSIGGMGDQSAYRGEWRHPSMTVTNRSNVTENFAFTYSSTNGGVVNNLATTQTCSAAMGQSCTAQHRMYAASQGSAQVTVTVWRQRPGESTASASYNVTVPNRSPSISLNVDRTSIEAGESVHLWASTSDPDGDGLSGYINTSDGLSYTWDTWKQYNNPGSYWVSAYVQDPYGGSSTSNGFTVTVRVPTCKDPGARNYGGPVPCWYNSPPDYLKIDLNTRWIYTGQSILATVTFNDAPEQDQLRGNVNRNDPNTAIEFGWTATPGSASVWLTYSNAGDYPVTATVYDGYPGGQIWAWGGYVHVENPTCQDSGATNYGGQLPCNYNPSVSLSASSYDPLAGESVTLTASGWDPNGDGLSYMIHSGVSSGNASSLTQSYAAGTYQAWAEVWDGRGGYGRSSDVQIRVTTREPPNQAPVASMRWTGGVQEPWPICDIFEYWESTSSDPEGGPLTYEWNYWEGTAMMGGASISNGGRRIMLQYWPSSVTTTAILKLKVTDNRGASSETQRSWSVSSRCP